MTIGTAGNDRFHEVLWLGLMHDRKIINSNWTKVNIKSDFLKHALEIGFKTSIHTQ